jgi:hypothetical protein
VAAGVVVAGTVSVGAAGVLVAAPAVAVESTSSVDVGMDMNDVGLGNLTGVARWTRVGVALADTGLAACGSGVTVGLVSRVVPEAPGVLSANNEKPAA